MPISTALVSSRRSTSRKSILEAVLAGLVLLGTSGEVEWELFKFSLSPFSQELKRLRPAKAVETTLPSKLVAGGGVGLASAPTMLIFGSAAGEDIIACTRVIALAADDFGRRIDILRKFPGNPWDRISKEMEKSDLAKSDPNSKPNRETTDQDIQDYFMMIFDEKNLQLEISAFNTAWDGSINFQKSSGNAELAKTAMALSEVNEAINILVSSADEKVSGSEGQSARKRSVGGDPKAAPNNR